MDHVGVDADAGSHAVLRRFLCDRYSDGNSPTTRRQEETEVDADSAGGGQHPGTSPDVQPQRGVRPTAQTRAGVSAREEAFPHPDVATGDQVHHVHVTARRSHITDSATLPVRDVTAGSDVIDDRGSRGMASVQRACAVCGRVRVLLIERSPI